MTRLLSILMVAVHDTLRPPAPSVYATAIFIVTTLIVIASIFDNAEDFTFAATVVIIIIIIFVMIFIFIAIAIIFEMQ